MLKQPSCKECNSNIIGGFMSTQQNSPQAGVVAADANASSGAGSGTDNAVAGKDVRRRVVTASFIGNFVEWFDYAVYGYLAAVISSVFFPEADRQTALLATFAVFAISFFVRPLGGFFW